MANGIINFGSLNSMTNNNQLILDIEALIFASEKPIEVKEICDVLTAFLRPEALDINNIDEAIKQLIQKYNSPNFSFEIKYINNGYQFLTKKNHSDIVNQLFLQKAKKKLSQSALETLAIIAYKQPITKTEIESIRGVNCDYSIQKLLDKELISISGKQDTAGRPLLYATSELFANYFGLSSMSDLPKIKDIEQPDDNIIGQEGII